MVFLFLRAGITRKLLSVWNSSYAIKGVLKFTMRAQGTMNNQSMKFQIDHNLEIISSGCAGVGYDFHLRIFNLQFVYFH